jgi:hypothetical protein
MLHVFTFFLYVPYVMKMNVMKIPRISFLTRL